MCSRCRLRSIPFALSPWGVCSECAAIEQAQHRARAQAVAASQIDQALYQSSNNARAAELSAQQQASGRALEVYNDWHVEESRRLVESAAATVDRLAVDVVVQAQKARIAELEAERDELLPGSRDDLATRLHREVVLLAKRVENQRGVIGEYQRKLDVESARANRLSDEAGAIRTERDELLRENAVLRRSLERAERKAGKR